MERESGLDAGTAKAGGCWLVKHLSFTLHPEGEKAFHLFARGGFTIHVHYYGVGIVSLPVTSSRRETRGLGMESSGWCSRRKGVNEIRTRDAVRIEGPP